MSHKGFRPVWIHDSLREGAHRQRRADSLRSGAIDHGFHYLGAQQAALWQAVHRCHAPHFADNSFAAMYRAEFGAVAVELVGRPVHVIGLGAGGGEKEAWLLEGLRQQGCHVRYTPVDTSLELALFSADVAAPYVHDDMVPVVGNLLLLNELPDWLARYPQEEARIYTAFGLTPNFLPSQIFSALGACLREQDYLFLNANLAPVIAGDDSLAGYRAACAAVLPQYDNRETRTWLRQILVDWDIARHLSEPEFTVAPVEGILGFVAHARWLSDVTFPWEGADFRAREGERLRLFFSLRYTPVLLAETLALHGMLLGRGQMTANGQEGVWRVGP